MFLKKKNFFDEPLTESKHEADDGGQERQEETGAAEKQEMVRTYGTDHSIRDEALAREIALVRQHCKESRQEKFLRKLSELEAYLNSSGFTAGVAGGPSTGKSTLVRKLDGLMERGIDLIDMPGEYFTNESDAAQTAFDRCDCVVLTISALQAFNMAEDTFLRERILTRKTPRVMVVLTRLDQVPSEQDRMMVFDYVRGKLSGYDAEIALYVSHSELLPGWESCSGVSAIGEKLLSWNGEAAHAELKKQKAACCLKEICKSLAYIYTRQLELLEEKENKERTNAAKKKKIIQDTVQIQWDDLETQMLARCSRNFEWLRSATEEKQSDIIEKLQYEISHTGNPKDWWERDYPYRIKMEMGAFGTFLENSLQNYYIKDVNWMNHVLQEKYKTAIPPKHQQIADKSVFRELIPQEKVEMEDMRRSRIISRVGTGAATVAGYAVFGLMGLSPVGMAIGIGGGVVSEIFMNRRLEEQKEKLSKVIAEELPKVFSTCVESVEEGIRRVYKEEITDMRETCEKWTEERMKAIDEAQRQSTDRTEEDSLRAKLAEIRRTGGF